MYKRADTDSETPPHKHLNTPLDTSEQDTEASIHELGRASIVRTDTPLCPTFTPMVGTVMAEKINAQRHGAMSDTRGRFF